MLIIIKGTHYDVPDNWQDRTEEQDELIEVYEALRFNELECPICGAHIDKASDLECPDCGYATFWDMAHGYY